MLLHKNIGPMEVPFLNQTEILVLCLMGLIRKYLTSVNPIHHFSIDFPCYCFHILHVELLLIRKELWAFK